MRVVLQLMSQTIQETLQVSDLLTWQNPASPKRQSNDNYLDQMVQKLDYDSRNQTLCKIIHL